MAPDPTDDGARFPFTLASEEATRLLACDLANAMLPGDMLTLSGDLGAGKTTFTRAFIRSVAGDDTIAVPSPTFTLIQVYELPRFPIVHADLYRLSNASELTELGFDDLPENAVVLLEWPDRAEGMLPPSRFDLTLTLDAKQGLAIRQAVLTGYGHCAARAERIIEARQFLIESGFAHAKRHWLQGDASTRAYERLRADGRSVLLMNSPRRADGPPVQNGKPYSAFAHLAEDVTPFVAMARALRERGFSAPNVHHADLQKGFLIIEDFGTEGVVRGEKPVPIQERYEVATDALLALHLQKLPENVPVSPHSDYVIPPYDIEAFLIEAELLLDWYIPRSGGRIKDYKRANYAGAWKEALAPALAAEKTWVLRDFHSPNLLWLPDRKGIERIGLLDFQDALMGPCAYDLASLLQDARVDVSEDLELSLLGRYVRGRRFLDKSFDPAAFTQIYATLAAQRASKILGIFARLERRDGKPQYLRHIPRIWRYLQRSLAHPALAQLAQWYKANVPEFSRP